MDSWTNYLFVCAGLLFFYALVRIGAYQTDQRDKRQREQEDAASRTAAE